jgi:hypothetical protein
MLRMPRIAGCCGARCAPMSLNREATEWKKMSRMEREVECIFCSIMGAFYSWEREHGVMASGGRDTMHVSCGRGKAWLWRGRQVMVHCRSALACLREAWWSGAEGSK